MIRVPMHIVALWLVGLAACQHVQTGCQVIDAAHKACILLRTRDENGAPVETRLTREELEGAVKAARARVPFGAH
jgi:hypothetical protein